MQVHLCEYRCKERWQEIFLLLRDLLLTEWPFLLGKGWVRSHGKQKTDLSSLLLFFWVTRRKALDLSAARWNDKDIIWNHIILKISLPLPVYYLAPVSGCWKSISLPMVGFHWPCPQAQHTQYTIYTTKGTISSLWQCSSLSVSVFLWLQ